MNTELFQRATERAETTYNLARAARVPERVPKTARRRGRGTVKGDRLGKLPAPGVSSEGRSLADFLSL